MENNHQSEDILSQECREPTLEDLVELCGWLNAEQARYIIVGGFAIRAAGYNRRTMDLSLLIETTLENEALIHRALEHMPDKAIREAKIGDVATYGVVRVADEYMVDLMKSGCGVTYSDAILDVVIKEVAGVNIPFASPATLWRMKQTVREKDAPDRLFLCQWATMEGIQLNPAPSPPATPIAPWAENFLGWLRRVLSKH